MSVTPSAKLNIPMKLVRRLDELTARAIPLISVPGIERGSEIQVSIPDQSQLAKAYAVPGFETLAKRHDFGRGSIFTARSANVDDGSTVHARRIDFVCEADNGRFGLQVFDDIWFTPLLPDKSTSVTVQAMKLVQGNLPTPYRAIGGIWDDLKTAIAMPSMLGESGFLASGSYVDEADELVYVEQPPCPTKTPAALIVKQLKDMLPSDLLQEMSAAAKKKRPWNFFPYNVLPVEPGNAQSRITALVMNQAGTFRNDALIEEGDRHVFAFLHGSVIVRSVLDSYYVVEAIPFTDNAIPGDILIS